MRHWPDDTGRRRPSSSERRPSPTRCCSPGLRTSTVARLNPATGCGRSPTPACSASPVPPRTAAVTSTPHSAATGHRRDRAVAAARRSSSGSNISASCARCRARQTTRPRRCAAQHRCAPASWSPASPSPTPDASDRRLSSRRHSSMEAGVSTGTHRGSRRGESPTGSVSPPNRPHGRTRLVDDPGVGRRPGVTATPLDLPVFTATGTVALSFDGCTIPPERVVAVENVSGWRAGDRVRAAIGQPAVLGVADRAIRLLDDLADACRCRTPSRRRTRRHVGTRRRPRRLGPDDDIEAHIASASDHRAACLDLARRATTALLAATGGRGMDLAHPAQRLAREVDFYVIQAQTADGRAATLRSVTR